MKLLPLAGLLFVASSIQAADIDAGKAKAATCAGCHGPAGVSFVPIYPNLAGQKSAYLEKQLKAFQAGTRTDPIMTAMAKPLSEDDIANVSAYFQSLGK